MPEIFVVWLAWEDGWLQFQLIIFYIMIMPMFWTIISWFPSVVHGKVHLSMIPITSSIPSFVYGLNFHLVCCQLSGEFFVGILPFLQLKMQISSWQHSSYIILSLMLTNWIMAITWIGTLLAYFRFQSRTRMIGRVLMDAYLYSIDFYLMKHLLLVDHLLLMN